MELQPSNILQRAARRLVIIGGLFIGEFKMPTMKEVEHISRVRRMREEFTIKVNKAASEVAACEYRVTDANKSLVNAEDELKFAEGELENFNTRHPEE
jgi:16S rRNA U1498 N3-methylase RsmE